MPTSASQRRPLLVHSVDEARAQVAAARDAGKSIGFVPTMGALHAGHLSLVEASNAECDYTVVSVFVNPTQFGPNEDFDRYPRTLEKDIAAVSEIGADLVFAPAVEEMYPPGCATHVELEGAAEPLEGQFRPGHFPGVATVVLKLFNAVAPDRAYFGQKDYQQTCVVRQLVRDFLLPVEIRVCPIVREPDGLALSSRNVYLDQDERQQALCVPRSLDRAEELVAAGETDPLKILDEMQSVFAAEPDIRIDYVALVEPETLKPVASVTKPTVAAVAVHVGKTRLIDNRLLTPPAPRR